MEAGETPRAAGTESPARPSGRSAIYSVELEVFEGPLDLLLHLVRRHELEILDIPIAFITEKYLAYLDLMRALDLEVAGDYLVMAATLAYLKSRELLPTIVAPSEGGEGDDEEGEDPREALIRRLVEYERFKNAAADLDALPVSGRDVFARGADIDIPPIDPGLAPVTLFRLAEAYYKVLTRAKINKSHEVQLEPVTVAQRMTQLTLLLDQKQSFDFEGLFLGRTWTSERELRGMLVVTLMSVLELVKLGVARVQQVPETSAIRVYRLEVTEETRALLDAYDEDESFGDAGRPPPPPPPPIPSDAELDAAEESALLAEALAGADDTDLGPDAGSGPAANTPTDPNEDAELAALAAELAALDAEAAAPTERDEPAASDEDDASDEEAELAAPEDEDAASDETAEDEDDASHEEPELAAREDAANDEEAELAALAAELAAEASEARRAATSDTNTEPATHAAPSVPATVEETARTDAFTADDEASEHAADARDAGDPKAGPAAPREPAAHERESASQDASAANEEEAALADLEAELAAEASEARSATSDAKAELAGHHADLFGARDEPSTHVASDEAAEPATADRELAAQDDSPASTEAAELAALEAELAALEAEESLRRDAAPGLPASAPRVVDADADDDPTTRETVPADMTDLDAPASEPHRLADPAEPVTGALDDRETPAEPGQEDEA